MLTPDDVRRAGRFAYAASAEGIPFRYHPEHQPYGPNGPIEVEFMRPDDGHWCRALIREDSECGWCFWQPQRWPLPENVAVAVLDTRFTFTVPQLSWHHLSDCDCEFCEGRR
jgi:hypothetical protein